MGYGILVVMSTYNGEKYIEEQIDSILHQKNCDVHILIRDDGSSDNTRNIINHYADEIENISILEANENLGPAKSFIELLRNAPDYEYYAFSDQDDIWDADKLAAGVTALMQSPDVLLYCANARLVDSYGRDLHVLANKQKTVHTNFETVMCVSQFMGCTMVFKHELVQIIKQKLLPETLIMHDHYLSCVCQLMGGEMIYDCIPHMGYRQHCTNVVGIHSNFAGKLQERMRIAFSPACIMLHEQGTVLMEQYGNEVSMYKKQFLKRIVDTDKNALARLMLACTRKVRYKSFNQSLTNRLAILLGHK